MKKEQKKKAEALFTEVEAKLKAKGLLNGQGPMFFEEDYCPTPGEGEWMGKPCCFHCGDIRKGVTIGSMMEDDCLPCCQDCLDRMFRAWD